MDRIEQLKQFLAIDGEDSFVQHALALEYIKRNKNDEAKALFEAILHRDENYVGSYYHLAKLLERQGKEAEALAWYEKGMAAAKRAGDNHAYNELRMAYDELTD